MSESIASPSQQLFGGREAPALEVVLARVVDGIDELMKFREITQRDGRDAAEAFLENLRGEQLLSEWGLAPPPQQQQQQLQQQQQQQPSSDDGGARGEDDSPLMLQSTLRDRDVFAASMAASSRRRGTQMMTGSLTDLMHAAPTLQKFTISSAPTSNAGKPQMQLSASQRVSSRRKVDYYSLLAVIRDAFEPRASPGASSIFDPKPPAGIPESEFVEFIAPAMTGTRDAYTNRCLAAQLDVNANGIILWDEFSTYFVHRSKVSEVTVSGTQFYYANGGKHHAQISKILFSHSHTNQPSWNPSVDRCCFTGGFDGTVHQWDSQFLDHVERVHYLPDANKQHRWINDMCFTNTGKLAIAQSRGFVYLYSVSAKAKPLLHRVLRAGRHTSGDDFESVIKMQIERNRFGSAAPSTRLTAATVPPWEICTLNTTTSNADVTCCTGIRSGVTGLHMEPLAVGFDNGMCSVFNVHKPVDIVTHVDPLVSFDFFAGGTVMQVFDDSIDNRLLCLGREKGTGGDSIHFVDFEKMVPVMQLLPKQRHHGSTLTRFDYDAQSGVLVAAGPSRCATLFSSSFPDPVAYLSDHNTPIVGVMHNAAEFQLYTVTEDCTYHLYDIRMNRKIMSAVDGDINQTMAFSCAGFDANRGNCVAGATIPVVLRETVENSASGKERSGLGSASLPTSPSKQPGAAAQGRRPSESTTSVQQQPGGADDAFQQHGGEMRYSKYNAAFEQLLAVEGGNVVVRSASDMFRSVTRVFRINAGNCSAMACDPSGRRFALAFGPKLALYSAMTGGELATCIAPLQATDDEITAVAFGSAPLTGSCIVVGCGSGLLIAFDDETSPQLTNQRQTLGSIVDIAVVAHATKMIVATTSGHISQLNLETFSMTRIFTFTTVHSVVGWMNPATTRYQDGSQRMSRSGALQNNVAATRAAATRAAAAADDEDEVDDDDEDDLDSFAQRSYASLNKSCESVAVIDPAHFAVLYGTGTVCFCKVVNTETLVICNFPGTKTGISGSCIAAAQHEKEHQLAVGDFDGGITLFSLRRYFNYDPRHAHPAMSFFAGPSTARWSDAPLSQGASQRSMLNSVYDYVALKTMFCVAKGQLVHSVFFVNATTLVAALQEVQTFVVCTTAGVLLSQVSSSPMPTPFIGAGESLCADGGRATNAELASHPFYFHKQRREVCSEGEGDDDSDRSGDDETGSSLQSDGDGDEATAPALDATATRRRSASDRRGSAIVDLTMRLEQPPPPPKPAAGNTMFPRRSVQLPIPAVLAELALKAAPTAVDEAPQATGRVSTPPSSRSSSSRSSRKSDGAAGDAVSPAPALPPLPLPQSDALPRRSVISQVLARSPDRRKQRSAMKAALPRGRVSASVAQVKTSAAFGAEIASAVAAEGPISARKIAGGGEQCAADDTGTSAQAPQPTPRVDCVRTDDNRIVSTAERKRDEERRQLPMAEAVALVIAEHNKRYHPQRPQTAREVTERLTPRHNVSFSHHRVSSARGAKQRTAALSAAPAIQYPEPVPAHVNLVTQQVFTAHPPCYVRDLPRPTTPIFASAAAVKDTSPTRIFAMLNAPHPAAQQQQQQQQQQTSSSSSSTLRYSEFVKHSNIGDARRGPNERAPGEMTVQLERALRAAKAAADVVGRGALINSEQIFAQLRPVTLPRELVASVNEYARTEREMKQAALKAAISRENTHQVAPRKATAKQAAPQRRV